MNIESALARMAEFMLRESSLLDEWIDSLKYISAYDVSLARKVQKHGIAHPSCVDALQQLQRKYPAEAERLFGPLLAELQLREGRAVLRGEEVEI